MKVINILGSPRRKGTSARIARSFTGEAEKIGAVIQDFYLNGMTFKGCQGCEYCHTKDDKCVLKDDLREVLEAMRSADIVVLASPVYYGDVTGQFKMFFDRTWSQVEVNMENEVPFTSRLAPGKTAVLILTQGNGEEKHADVIDRYNEALQIYGFDLKTIRATGLMSGAADEDVSDAQQEAVTLARSLVK